jgi:hypothetical protein
VPGILSQRDKSRGPADEVAVKVSAIAVGVAGGVSCSASASLAPAGITKLWFSQIQIWLIQWELHIFRHFPPTVVLLALLASTMSVFRTRSALQLEILLSLGFTDEVGCRCIITDAYRDRVSWYSRCEPFFRYWM